MEKRCKFLFGYTYSEFCLLDSPNVIGNESSELAVAEGNNLPFYALANDPLCGLLDRHIPDGAQEEYAATVSYTHLDVYKRQFSACLPTA